MTPLEYISDILAKAERFLEQNKGKWEEFRLVFKKKLHLDPTYVSEDSVENTLDYYQFMGAVRKGTHTAHSARHEPHTTHTHT